MTQSVNLLDISTDALKKEYASSLRDLFNKEDALTCLDQMLLITDHMQLRYDIESVKDLIIDEYNQE